MLKTIPIDPSRQMTPEPPDLLSRLARHGVRVLDSRRFLVLEAPREVLEGSGWSDLEEDVERFATHLQLTAALIGWSRDDLDARALVDRILDLPADCAPAVLETLGGIEGLAALERGPESAALLDLCHAAYLRGLTYQVDHDLEPDDGPRVRNLVEDALAAESVRGAEHGEDEEGDGKAGFARDDADDPDGESGPNGGRGPF